MILKTKSNSSVVIINSASVKNKVTMTENHEELITKAAIFIRSDIEEYCNGIPAFTCSELKTETLEQGVKYVQS